MCVYPAEQKANPVYSTNKYYISNFNNNSTTRLGRRKVNSGEREKKSYYGKDSAKKVKKKEK